MQDVDKLLKLRNKLREFQKYKQNNALDFIKWEKYEEQADIINRVLHRLEVREGPFIFVVFGANRSGKSETGGGIVAEIFKRFRNFRLWCATLSDISIKVQQSKLAKLIRQVDISYGEYNQVRGWKNRTIISNLQTVCYMKTYEQGAGSFQGDSIDFAWLDEECPYDVFLETLVRLADRSGVMLLTFTSLQGFTRLVNRLWESNDPNVVTFTLLAKNNPYLSEQEKKQIFESIDPDELESRWEGKPHLKTGLIYKEFNQIHKIQRFDYAELVKNDPTRWSLSEGIDPHERTPHHWLRFLYDKSNDILYVVDEIKAPHESMLIEDFSRLIKMNRKSTFPTLEKYLDWTQIDTSSMKPDVITRHPDEHQDDSFTIRKEFSRCGIPTILVTKDNAVGINQVKARLKTVKTMSGEIKRKPKLYVFDDLKGFLFEISRYAWDSYATAGVTERKELINKPIKKNDHFMDILKYECIKRKIIDTDVVILPQDDLYSGIGY